MSGPLTDRAIRDRVKIGRDAAVIGEVAYLRLEVEPFHEATKVEPCGRQVVGYGITSMGYDVRLDTAFRRVLPLEPGACAIDIADPNVGLNFGPVERVGMYEPFVLEPHGCALGQTIERFRIPPDVLAVVMGKSTMARCFLNLNCTPLEPGWQGKITLELANLTARPLIVRPGFGIGQVVFLAAYGCPDVTYDKKPGAAYQDQDEPTLPRLFPPPSVERA